MRWGDEYQERAEHISPRKYPTYEVCRMRYMPHAVLGVGGLEESRLLGPLRSLEGSI